VLSYFKGKRVSVLGATGLIGSYAVKALVEAGADVLAIGRARPQNDYTRMARHFGRYDLHDRASADEAIKGCEVVINCAGITGGIGLAHTDPLGYVGPATALACNVIHACHEAKARLGFLSSTTVYAPCEAPVFEEDPLTAPPYPLYAGIGYSKRFLEQLCRYYHEKAGLEVAVVRPSGAYGRWDNFDEATSHVIPGMINRALRLKPGEPFEVWGDGLDVRDFVHAADVAAGLLLAVAKSPNADPINIASGMGTTTAELAAMVLTAAGHHDFRLEFRADKPTALRSRTVSIEKARKVLGYEPTVSLADGLRDTVEWRRACAS
jgi:GDP-L-fucose synthase